MGLERLRHAWPCEKCKQTGTMDGTLGSSMCEMCQGHGWLHYCHGKRMRCAKIISAKIELCPGCEYDQAHTT